MHTPVLSPTPTPGQPTAADADPFDLNISFIETEPIIPELLRSTSDNCGGTCSSACTSCSS
jgi:FxLD family lantipeptide